MTVLSTPSPSLADSVAERRVDTIILTGNRRTKTWFILRELTFQRGEIITAADIEASRQNLMNMELFSSVDIVESTVTDEDTLSIEVIVKEKWSILPLPIITRTSDRDIRLGLSYHDFNLGGRGHYLNVKVYNKWVDDFEHRLGREYSVSLYARNFLKTDYAISPQFTKGHDIERTYSNGNVESSYWKRLEEYNMGIGRERGDMEMGIRFSTRKSTYAYLSGVKRSYKDTTINTLGPYIILDKINNLGDYRFSGYMVSLSVAPSNAAIGSDVNAVTYSVDYQRHIPLKRRKSIAYRMMGAVVTGDITGDLKVSTGGATSIRGYEKEEFEGNRVMQLNSEYRFPITEDYWGGVLFVDAGNAWRKGASIGPEDLNWGAGFGFRLYIKQIVKGIGRLDFAYNLSLSEFKGYIGAQHTF